MPAVRLLGWQSEPELVAVPAPEPGPGEVLVKVEAAGLCHSDLHLMDWPAGTVPYRLPFTLGHETAGTVAAIGPGARGVAEGDRVPRPRALGLRRLLALPAGDGERLRDPGGATLAATAAGSAATAAWPTTWWCRRPGTWCRSAISIPSRPRRSPTPR